MNKFIEKFASHIKGVLTGFDRVVFRGHLLRIVYRNGMMSYLWAQKVLLKEFGRHVEETSRQIKEASLGIAARDRIQEGLVCVLSCVEPCMSFEVHRNAQTQTLDLRSAWRKCLPIYQYWKHP